LSLVGDDPRPSRELSCDHRVDRELEEAVVVEFPLRGERWVAVTTPGDRIPSHRVNMLGERYAYDLLKVDERKGVHYHPAGSLRGLLIGGRTQECYAWGAPIHSPFDGEIVRAVDGVAERSWIQPVREAAPVLKNALTSISCSPPPPSPRRRGIASAPGVLSEPDLLCCCSTDVG
jgi:hypothetical protein